MDQNNEEQETVYSGFLLRCKKLGISISYLSRKSGVHRQVFDRWRERDPKSISQYRAINKALNEIEKENNKDCSCSI